MFSTNTDELRSVTHPKKKKKKRVIFQLTKITAAVWNGGC